MDEARSSWRKASIQRPGTRIADLSRDALDNDVSVASPSA